MNAGREYATEEIVVEWRPSLCYHSQNCIAALPAVFNPEARPWVNVHAANTGAVEAAVAQCPSGALRSRRLAQPPRVEADDRAEVRVLENGPLLLRGHLRVFAADGSELAELERAALCRYGNSQNKPFCDGSHARVGFRG